MKPSRRDFLTLAGAFAVFAPRPRLVSSEGANSMYGLIGKLRAVPGQRDALISILLEGIEGMPGCLSYVVAKDSGDANALWITEVWDSADSHKASLSLPSVKNAISRGKPLIAGFEQSVTTAPVGGHGLVRTPRR